MKNTNEVHYDDPMNMVIEIYTYGKTIDQITDDVYDRCTYRWDWLSPLVHLDDKDKYNDNTVLSSIEYWLTFKAQIKNQINTYKLNNKFAISPTYAAENEWVNY